MKRQPNPMRRPRTLVLTAILTFAVAACAGAAMGGPPGQRYAVTIINEFSSPMIVSVDDGSTTRLLGTVGAERQERFVLDGAMGTTISIIARDEGDTRTVRRTVVLQAGGTVEVRLAPND